MGGLHGLILSICMAKSYRAHASCKTELIARSFSIFLAPGRGGNSQAKMVAAEICCFAPFGASSSAPPPPKETKNMSHFGKQTVSTVLTCPGTNSSRECELVGGGGGVLCLLISRQGRWKISYPF